MSVLCQFPFRAGGRGRGAMEQWGGRDILHNPGPGPGSITTSGKTHFLLTTLSRYTGEHADWYTATHPLSRAKSFLWIIFWLYGDLSSANNTSPLCVGWDYVAQVYSPTNGATNHEIMHGPRSCHHLLTLHHYHGNMSGASTRVGVLCAHFIFFSYFLSYLNPHHQRACHKGYIKEEMWLDYPQPIHQAFVL